MPSQTPPPNVSPSDDLAAQFKRYHQRIASLERASTSGGGTGLEAARPVGTTPGQHYWATDTKRDWLFTGTAWIVNGPSLQGGNTSNSLGGFPAGQYTWPTPSRDIGDYGGTMPGFYTSAGGALQAGVFGFELGLTANASDTTTFSIFLNFAGDILVGSAMFAYAAGSFYAERALNVGDHVTWQLYKAVGSAAWTSAFLRVTPKFRAT